MKTIKRSSAVDKGGLIFPDVQYMQIVLARILVGLCLAIVSGVSSSFHELMEKLLSAIYF